MILDVDEYEALMDEVELVRDIRDARAELNKGKGLSHNDVIEELRARLLLKELS